MFNLVVISLLVLVYFLLDTLFIDYVKHKKTKKMILRDITSFLTKEKDFISNFMEQLSNNFQCHNCQEKKCVSDVIALGGIELGQSEISKPHKFILLTCQSCAKTDLFNLNSKFKNDHYDNIRPNSLNNRKVLDDVKLKFCTHCRSQDMKAKKVRLNKPKFKNIFSPGYSIMNCISCMKCSYAILQLETSDLSCQN